MKSPCEKFIYSIIFEILIKFVNIYVCYFISIRYKFIKVIFILSHATIKKVSVSIQMSDHTLPTPQLNIEVPFDPNGKTAIFAKYAEQSGKKFSQTGFVNVTASSIISESASDIIDIGDASIITDDDPNSYIEFHFLKNEINPTGYVIQTGEWSHLKNWKFEGSKDGNKWDLLDSQWNNSDLNGEYKSKSFEITKCTQKYSHFRLTQTGENHFGDNYLSLSYFDIFGKSFAK